MIVLPVVPGERIAYPMLGICPDGFVVSYMRGGNREYWLATWAGLVPTGSHHLIFPDYTATRGNVAVASYYGVCNDTLGQLLDIKPNEVFVIRDQTHLQRLTLPVPKDNHTGACRVSTDGLTAAVLSCQYLPQRHSHVNAYLTVFDLD